MVINISSKHHDDLVTLLADRLKGNPRHLDDIIRSEIEYKYPYHGEIDLFCIDYDRKYGYSFEMKTTNHNKARRKAKKKQLPKNIKYLKKTYNLDRIYSFYVYRYENVDEKFRKPNSDKYTIKLVKYT